MKRHYPELTAGVALLDPTPFEFTRGRSSQENILGDQSKITYEILAFELTDIGATDDDWLNFDITATYWKPVTTVTGSNTRRHIRSR